MDAEYKRENHKSYFVVKDQRLEELPDEGTNDPYGMKMICDNSIRGLLPISLRTFNGEKELYYDISSKQSLRILYEKREFSRDDLRKLFLGMQTAIGGLEEYLLDMECLIIDPDYIYINAADESISLLYYPFEEEDFEKTVYEFADYILEKVCNEDEQAVMYAYGFYRYVKEEQGDLKEAIRRILEDKSRETECEEFIAAQENPPEDVGFYPDEDEMNFYEEKETVRDIKKYDSVMIAAFFGVLGLVGIGMILYSARNYGLSGQNLFTVKESVVGAGIFVIAITGLLLFAVTGYLHRKKRAASEKKEEKEIYEKPTAVYTEPEITEVQEMQEGGYTETVLLEENCYREQRILTGRIRGRKKQIDLSSFPFIIGKSKEQADYVLEDPSVSRLHARFTLRDDVVYLTDLNSTNGTSKNGIKLEPNELVMLEADDEITFGRVTFTYH